MLSIDAFNFILPPYGTESPYAAPPRWSADTEVHQLESGRGGLVQKGRVW